MFQDAAPFGGCLAEQGTCRTSPKAKHTVFFVMDSIQLPTEKN